MSKVNMEEVEFVTKLIKKIIQLVIIKNQDNGILLSPNQVMN